VLFTTLAFACAFLPVALIVFFALGRRSPLWAAGWLFAASLFFYGYWAPEYVLLLLVSIVGNFWVGQRIARLRGEGEGPRRHARRWLIAGVVANLALLGYYKYAGFFIANLNALTGAGIDLGRIVLPIGISFFTFTQIAFLADAYSKGVKEYRFIHYGLFVTYFPHLVAGPVLHHAQMMPQFALRETYRPQALNLACGLALFALGLAKKVLLADGISPYADATFNAAARGEALTANEAWLGAAAYSFQLYFDFSGYSDMAIGLSWMFNVRLPINFNSPYRATNIVEFWRRWHITLSQFLRDYLYIALGGNRFGVLRRHTNLMVTMLLGGLWHGANWTFVLWGGLHGLYLVVNHGWRALLGEARLARLGRNAAYRLACWALTMLAVMLAWVFFRAETFSSAMLMLRAMLGGGTTDVQLWNAGLDAGRGWWLCALCGALAFLAPNSNTIGERLRVWLASTATAAAATHVAAARAAIAGAALTLTVFLLLINALRDSISAFIYFNF
jgi:alginate O-acetyltransferase complex protein AlgI